MYASGITYTGVTAPGPAAGTLTAAANGLSVDPVTPTTVVLGQDYLDPANPAILSNDREIPMNLLTIHFNDLSAVLETLMQSYRTNMIGCEAFGFPADMKLNDAIPAGGGVFNSWLERTRKISTDGWEDYYQNQNTGDQTFLFYNDDASVEFLQMYNTEFRWTVNQDTQITAKMITPALTLQSHIASALPNLPSITLKDAIQPANLVIGLDVTNARGSVSSTHLNLATSVFVGNTTTNATARLHLVAGTAAANTGPLKLTAGTNVTTPEAGLMEYNGTDLFFTKAATREAIVMGTSGAAAPATSPGVAITNFYGTAATNYLGDPNSWIAVKIGATTFKIPAYT